VPELRRILSRVRYLDLRTVIPTGMEALRDVDWTGQGALRHDPDWARVRPMPPPSSSTGCPSSTAVGTPWQIRLPRSGVWCTATVVRH